MVLQCDGWDTSAKHNLINCLLSAIEGDEFLCDVDATGQDKGAAWMASETLRMVGVCKVKHGREPDAVCTDNPTVMQSARAQVKAAKPNLLLCSCMLHGISKLIEDLASVPAIKSVIDDWLTSESLIHLCIKPIYIFIKPIHENIINI